MSSIFSNTFQTEITEMERELRNLKQVQGGIANVASYMYETTLDGYSIFTHTVPEYKVTFESEPTLVSYTSGLFEAVPLKKEGNVQYISGGFLSGKVYIASSSPVVSVERVS